MAGEWIPIDCNLGTKPEVLELVDETGEPVEVVVYRLIQLWSWASMNTADGTIRTTPARLAAVAGGGEAFWLAVARVGWLRFDGPHATVEGWEKRFSRAAKARMEDARRKATDRAVRRLSEKCPEKTGLEERTVQDRTEDKKEIPAAPVPTNDPATPSRSRAKPAVSWSADDGWQGITDADRSEWATAFPGAALDQELAKATAWLRANPKRCGKRNWRRFLVGWLQRCQDKGGTHREPGNRPAGPPPVDPARRRFYRSDAGRNMTDAEYAVWQRDRNSGGTTAALATALRLTEEART
jgi:hypothetical protein